MRIIEQFVHGKRGEALCEDGIMITDHYVAVIDGSTSKSTAKLIDTDKTGGQIARDVVKEIVRAADPQFDMWTFCHHASELMQMEYHWHMDAATRATLDTQPENRFCCSAIIYSRHWNELWMIGDCHGLIIDTIGSRPSYFHIKNDKPYEKDLAKMRSEFLTMALTDGVLDMNGKRKVYTIEELRKKDIGRELLMPQLLNAMRDENITYPVIDGFPTPMKKCPCWGNFIKGVNQLVLATDGYPRLFPTLEKTEAYLQKLLAEDPLCIKKHKATKGWMEGTESFDDRAYVRIEI